MVLRTLRLPTSSPDRLVAELRMAQFAAVDAGPDGAAPRSA